MVDNIITLITERLGGSVTETARKMTGLGSEQIDSTVRAAIPAILASISSVASTPSTKQAIESALSAHAKGAPAAAGGSELQVGSGLSSMRSVLGESQLGKLASAIGSYAGIGDGNSRSIIGLLAPVVLGVLGRQQRLGDGNVDGVLDMLSQQKAAIASALPSGLASSLQTTGLLDKLGDGARAATTRSADTAKPAAAAQATEGTRWTNRAERRSSAPWLLGIGGLAVVAALGWALMRGDDSVEREAQNVSGAAREIAAAPSFRVGATDIGSELGTITDSLTSTLRSVTNDTTAAAALPQITMLSERVDGLTSLAERLPPETKPALANTLNQSAAAVRAEVQRIAGLDSVSNEVREAVGAVGTKIETFMAALRATARG